MNAKSKWVGCKVYTALMLVTVLLFSQVLVTYANEGIDIKIEKKNVTISAATKGASIKTGDNVVISGEGFGTSGNIVSVGIIPAGTSTTNTDQIYENVKIIYSNSVDYKAETYNIKNGKFSVTTRFFCAFEASAIPKGSYRAIVWWIPQGQGSRENMAVSTKAFSTLGDGKLIVLGDSGLYPEPSIEKSESNWKLIFEPSAAVKIQSGDYIRFEGIPSDTVLLPGAKATIQSGKNSLVAAVSLENSKKIKNKKDLVIKFSGTVILAAKTRATLSIDKIKNPAAGSTSVFCGLYSKSNVLTGYGSGSLFIIEPPPEIKILQAPPEKITFRTVDGILQSEPFTVTVGYDLEEQMPSMFQMRLVDEKGEFINTRDLGFFQRISENSTSNSDALNAQIVNGKVVFSNIVLATYNQSLNLEKVYLYFQDSLNYTTVPVTSNVIKLEQIP